MFCNYIVDAVKSPVAVFLCIFLQLIDAQVLGNFTPISTTLLATRPPPPPDPTPSEAPGPPSEAYLWLPLIVVVIFTGIMVTLIIMGRKRAEAENRDNPEAGATNVERTPSDPDRDPGLPATPPPSYTVLERELSYVSHVSQRSDEVSVPPDYIEALHLPKTDSTRRPRQPVSRQSTNRHANARPSFLRSLGNRGERFRLFSRSASQQESRRNPSDTSAISTDTNADNGTSRLSDVFFDLSPSHSPLQGVGEVAESSTAAASFPSDPQHSNKANTSPTLARSISLDNHPPVTAAIGDNVLSPSANSSQLPLLANQGSPQEDHPELT